MFIFYFVYTKHQVLLICNENKEIHVANLMIQMRFIFSWELIFWVIVLNGQTYQVSRLRRDSHASGLFLTLTRPPTIVSRLGITSQKKKGAIGESIAWTTATRAR